MTFRIVACLAAGLAALLPVLASAQAPDANSANARIHAEFLTMGPHRAFVVGGDGKPYWYAGVGGPDPGGAIASALKRCAERSPPPCRLQTVNNVTGYRRILLAGQSAGAWVSLAALARGAPVDGVISIAAAHHGEVVKMKDPTRARGEWQNMLEAIKPGARLVVVNFANDAYDVGGRMEDARRIFAKTGVAAEIVDAPEGFAGHGAGAGIAFARKFGPCLQAFVEQGTRQPPCAARE